MSLPKAAIRFDVPSPDATTSITKAWLELPFLVAWDGVSARDIVARIGVKRPDDTAVQLALLIDGAFTSDGRLSKSNAVRILQNAADALLRDTGARHRR